MYTHKRAIKAMALCLTVLAFTGHSRVFAGCEEDCKTTKSCKEYIDCRKAELECLAACKQLQAQEASLMASQKLAQAAERMTEVLERTMAISEKIVAVLDKLILKLTEQQQPEQKPAE